MNRNLDFGNYATMPHGYTMEKSIAPRYEKLSNGDVEYVCTIDVNNFTPSEIRIEQNGMMLTIEAKKSKSGTKQGLQGQYEESEYKELKREISLPNNIDLKKEFRSVYTDNGLLEIRIPILPQSYSTLYPPVRRPITIQRTSPQHVNFNMSPQLSSPVFSTTLNTMDRRSHSRSVSPFDDSVRSNQNYMRSPNIIIEKSKNYVEEISIDPLYKPEDLMVRVKGSRVIIKAKHEEIGLNGYKTTKEFNDEHEVPNNIDLDNLKASLLGNGTLLIEAPYKQVELVKTPIMVHHD